MALAPQRGRVGGERAVVAAVPAEPGQRDEHLARVGDHPGPIPAGERLVADPRGHDEQPLQLPAAGVSSAVASSASSATPRSARPSARATCAGGFGAPAPGTRSMHSTHVPGAGRGMTGSPDADHGARGRHRGARFLVGLRHHLRAAHPDGDGGTTAEVTVVGNTGDDIRLFGLQICPDLDTLMYTLGGGISAERGWGREGETFVVKDELAAYGVAARLVRARRQGHRDAPGAHPDAHRGLPRLSVVHRGAVRALGTASAMPRTGAPPTMGETPTTGPRADAARRGRPAPAGSCRSTRPGSTAAGSRRRRRRWPPARRARASRPRRRPDDAVRPGSRPRRRIHHSWKWMARRARRSSPSIDHVGLDPVVAHRQQPHARLPARAQRLGDRARAGSPRRASGCAPGGSRCRGRRARTSCGSTP